MPISELKITDASGGAAFTIRVVSRAKKVELADMQDDGVLKIRLTASSSTDDDANTQLVDFLAEILEVDKSKIEIVAGAKSRDKLVSIDGVHPEAVEARMKELLKKDDTKD